MQEKKILSFEDVKDVKLESSEREAFLKLGGDRDFLVFKKVVEDYVLKLTYNLAVGNAISRDARHEEMDKLSGFVYFWNKIIDLTKSKKEENEKVD